MLVVLSGPFGYQRVDFVAGGYERHLQGAEDYVKWNVRTVPTVVVLDDRNRVLGRFEGPDEVREAPGEIARLARERGMQVPDPPAPYSRGKRTMVEKLAGR